MVGQTTSSSSLNFMEELDFFDQMDDLIDFPSDDIDAILSCPSGDAVKPNFFSAADNKTEDDGTGSFLPPSIWAAHPGSDPGFPNHSASDLSAELSVPYEDIVQLEWLSTFVEDSFSGGSLTMNKNECSSFLDKDLSSSSSHGQHFRTSSPVSVLESSSSCSGDQKGAVVIDVGAGKCGRARSKRPRPATFTPRPPMQHLISPTSSITETITPHGVCLAPKAHSDSENYAESRLLIKIPTHLLSEHKAEPKKKKKKVKVTAPTPPAPALEEESNNSEEQQQQQQQAVRKCMHCEVTKTPQWRAGPMGPKTLCNACGVRFKSGRLFPEYRPAASPTFVPTLHSNSHKKVVEMRTKVVGDEMFGGIDDGSLIPGQTNQLPHYSPLTKLLATMATSSSLFLLLAFIMQVITFSFASNFQDDIAVTFGDGRVRIQDGGNLMSLSLDNSSGSGFQSKADFLYAKVDMKIKLVPGDSAGTVTSFYLKSQGTTWDEIDMEFLGNTSGDPYVLHTNVFVNGNGNREQQFNLWFDPTTDFHSYSIIWNPSHIVLVVDDKPLREYRNLQPMNVPYPTAQPMKLYGSIWNADDWATRGGRVKTDWSKAPFTASFSNYNADGNKNAPWYSVERLDGDSVKQMEWVQKNYMVYNYCSDPSRFPGGLPAECNVGKN